MQQRHAVTSLSPSWVLPVAKTWALSDDIVRSANELTHEVPYQGLLDGLRLRSEHLCRLASATQAEPPALGRIDWVLMRAHEGHIAVAHADATEALELGSEVRGLLARRYTPSGTAWRCQKAKGEEQGVAGLTLVSVEQTGSFQVNDTDALNRAGRFLMAVAVRRWVEQTVVHVGSCASRSGGSGWVTSQLVRAAVGKVTGMRWALDVAMAAVHRDLASDASVAAADRVMLLCAEAIRALGATLCAAGQASELRADEMIAAGQLLQQLHLSP